MFSGLPPCDDRTGTLAPTFHLGLASQGWPCSRELRISLSPKACSDAGLQGQGFLLGWTVAAVLTLEVSQLGPYPTPPQGLRTAQGHSKIKSPAPTHLSFPQVHEERHFILERMRRKGSQNITSNPVFPNLSNHDQI